MDVAGLWSRLKMKNNSPRPRLLLHTEPSSASFACRMVHRSFDNTFKSMSKKELEASFCETDPAGEMKRAIALHLRQP